MASDRKEMGQLSEQLFNKLQREHRDQPVVAYKKIAITGTKGGVDVWQGQCVFEGEIYSGEGRSKHEVKSDVHLQIFQHLQVGESEGDSRGNPQQLTQIPPPNAGKKRKRGSVGKGVLARKEMKREALKKKEEVINDKGVVVFFDQERVRGEEEAPPLSFGLAVVDKNGKTISSKEIYILPEGEDPKENSYCAKKVHHMYIARVRGVKVLKLRGGGGDDEVLAALSPKEAALALLQYLSTIGTELVLAFHGKDDKSLLLFLTRLGLEQEFNNLVWHLVDTREFFYLVQESKVGMKSIVQDWASKETKEKYSSGAHSALVDAETLGVICMHKELANRFCDWIYLATE